MPNWADLLNQFQGLPDDTVRGEWIVAASKSAIADVSRSNVVLYASAFLQKPQAPPQLTSVTHEDLNGFMSAIHGMDWSKPLTLILHTPGGSPNAAETIVGYLRSKFPGLEVIVPTYAFSAGTMISLAADRIILGRQSQLGPIDPQFVMGPQLISAQAIVDQFAEAKREITANPITAHAWAPVLSSIGPALLQEATNALTYGEKMVETWLAKYMFANDPGKAAVATAIAKHFNDAQTHRSHGRRIDRDSARAQGLVIEDLEADQALQEAVLTAYHLATIGFEKSQASKVIWGSTGAAWIKSFVG